MIDLSREDLEVRILAIIIANSTPPNYDGFTVALKKIRPIDMTDGAKSAYLSIVRNVGERRPLTLHNVTEYADNEKFAVQAFYASRSELGNKENLSLWLDGLKEVRTRNCYIEVLQEGIDSVRKGSDPLTVDSSMRPAVGDVLGDQITKDIVGAGEACERLKETLGSVWNGTAAKIPLIPSLFKRHSDLLGGGWWRGKANIIGGRPANGKSTLAEQEVVEMARNGEPSVIASVEMTPEEYLLRMAIRISGTRATHREIYRQSFDDSSNKARLVDALEEVKSLPIYFAANTNAYEELLRRTRCAIDACGGNPAFIVVDYIQKVVGDERANRVREIGRMAVGFEKLAAESGAALLLLSQLKRKEGFKASKDAQATDPRPTMEDLRESGELEQMALTVTMVHKPRSDNLAQISKAELVVAKTRNGQEGIVEMDFDGPGISWMEPKGTKDNMCPWE